MNLLAKLLAWKPVRSVIINQALKNPDEHIENYMYRFWLFNCYNRKTRKTVHSWLPLSARVHIIRREDQDRALHDHPWNARTFILDGWYEEIREDGRRIRREAGDTARLNFGEYHQIVEVCPGGVTTLFVMGKYRGVWGFKVNGLKVPFYDYLKDKA